MRHIEIKLLLGLSLVLTSCGGDDQYTPDVPDEDKKENPVVNTDNTNGNTIDDKSATRLEMPHIDASLFFAPHYVTYNGREIMNLAVEWNSSMRHAAWVAFSWDSTTSQDNVSRGSSWKWDPLIPSSYNAVKDSDHSSDGFDKGHLCASEDRVYCTEANDQTFYLSNISPQMSSFNQKFWARLEAKVQEWGRLTQKGTFDTLYVVKGGNLNNLLTNYTGSKAGSDKVVPYTNSNGFSKGNLAVPSYYFMAILARKGNTYQAIAFYVPHSEDLPSSPSVSDFQQYAISIDYLESLIGIDLFCNLPDATEKSLENKCNFSDWNW